MNQSIDLIQKTADAVRVLSMDAVQQANSGHPGLPMGIADVAATLWCNHLRMNPSNPLWFNRDRFVLSCGHGSMLLYSLLHLSGFDLSLDDLKNFRKLDSKTPGHPEYGHTTGVETTTGPLGQGLANAVGMALAESHLATLSDDESVNHFTYAIVSDGDLQEGISHEACSFAGHNKLNKLIVFYDHNQISIDGQTGLSFSENINQRFESYNWHTQSVDGHNINEINDAIINAQNETDKPSIIACKTIIGKYSPNKAGKASAHGAPLGIDEINATKEAMSYSSMEPFFVEKDVYDFFLKKREEWEKIEEQWQNKLLSSKHYDLINQFKAFELDNTIIDDIVEFKDAIATRSASGEVLNQIFPKIPQLMGGSADLTPSNNTLAKNSVIYNTETREGRYIHYGVREHGMAGIMNGMALHSGIIPYSGTFLVFSDYMRPSIRLAALMGLQVIYVFTHDSIGLGEDGPTHQPIEHLHSFRGMPNMTVLRPADGNETIFAWKYALENKTGPTALVLSRQKINCLSTKKLAENLKYGAYILEEDEDFEIILMASGSEVELAKKAKIELNKQGKKVRLISVPSTQIFDQQSSEYKNFLLPNHCPYRIAIEAGAPHSWHGYVGSYGKVIGMNSYGASAPYQQLYEKFHLTVENIVKSALNIKN